MLLIRASVLLSVFTLDFFSLEERNSVLLFLWYLVVPL